MNKNVKKLIAFVLIICMLEASLVSCSIVEKIKSNKNDTDDKVECSSSDNYFPEGYTGGFGIPEGSGVEYYWVETYEECYAAIELLKSHGSTFEEWPVFTYNGELFDTKYCFKMKVKQADKIEYGENPFDRKAEGVSVWSYVFIDEVEIDELIYENIGFYDAYILFVPGISPLGVLDEYPSAEGFTYEWIADDSTEHFSGAYWIYVGDDLALSISPVYRGGHELSDEILKAVLDSIVVIK